MLYSFVSLAAQERYFAMQFSDQQQQCNFDQGMCNQILIFI